ncbi:unnamed protein product [Rotaria socialis]|uniref:Uncharacterized protein n=1 Tax=Rotaria socialis TaxID=392032 RepID=A0A821EBP5_9BILA|nr:unnamed protein product [Rotaria socialis]CAF4490044.1 unnamed protein product [Rotaria socialis]CAF4633943.1 unnamed protein product [Rotaria socialis]CAF4662224.1 unnamed protein product [Rotaria socialis]CAF4741022.1 unnamed protein product [Rotaria socialis]
MDAAIEQYAPTETHNDTPTVSLSLPYGLHPSCLHMQVRSGSKTKNLVQFVIRKLISSDQNSTNIEQVTWNAFDDGYKRIEQIWQPVNVDVELDTLKVNKDVPALWKLYRRQHPLTTGAVFISWFFSILFVFLLPLDNSSAAYRECIQNNSASTSTITPDSLNRSNSKKVLCPRPWSHVDQRSYGVLWHIIYWTPQFLIWICFTTYAVNLSNRSNFIYYETLLLIFGILVTYMAVNYKLNASNFKATIIAASTTWGLFLLVLMLGYGPVQVPLDVYHHSRTSYMLSHIQFKLSKRYS